MRRYHCICGGSCLAWVDEAKPEHNKDFCAVCGACLHCDGGHECSDRGIGRAHIWVVYESVESLAQHNAGLMEPGDE